MNSCKSCGFLLEEVWFLCPRCGKKTFLKENTLNLDNGNALSALFKKQNINHEYISFNQIDLTDKEKKELEKLGDFFSIFDEDQKKAIVIDRKRVLCIAGAGSGKTKVLTKRIEYFVKYRNVNPKNILAITFTRKAAFELKERLQGIADSATISTFNAFCESNLIEYEHFYYAMPYRMISQEESKKLLKHCITELKIDVVSFLEDYFDMKLSDDDNINEYCDTLLEDILSLIDFIKNDDLDLNYLKHSLSFISDYDEKKLCETFFDIICLYEKKKAYIGLRDYSDQVSHLYKLLKEHPQIKKKISEKYTHIFVDEYQDVNLIQTKLIDEILSKDSYFFVVGDPRQGIFGFRGSDINYILNFAKKYETADVVFLNFNYRSSNQIIKVANESIRQMGLPDIMCSNNKKSNNNDKESKDVYLIECEDEEKESEYVSLHIKRILNEGILPKDVFVLARTNFQIEELEKHFKSLDIPYMKKSIDDFNIKEKKYGDYKTKNLDNKKDSHSKKVTLSTIHAIKGLEAKIVFVIGIVPGLFPCVAKEKKVLQNLKRRTILDSFEDEVRLFYVAITRAKERLYMTYYSSYPSLRKKDINPLLSKELLLLLKRDKY